MTRTYLTWALTGVVCLAVIVVLWPPQAGSPAERQALQEGRVIITYWDRHSGHEHEMRVELFDEYNATQGVIDGVFVRALPIGYSLEKLLTAIAGGAPPDLCSLEGSILASLAPQGCFQPLDQFMARHDFLDKERFFPHTLKAASYDGVAYAIPTTTDVTALLWNKDAFRRAGLDPERPPQTVAELEEYAAKLTIHDESGSLVQIGFLPWLPWDLTYLWGGMFGGTWFDDETGLVVCGDDPAIIETFEWVRTFMRDPADPDPPAYAMDASRVAAFRTGFGAYMSASNPFYTGQVAMITEGEWQVTFIDRYAPELDWGVAPLPQPEGVELRCYSPSAVIDAIPTGAANPEAAKKLLEWFYAPRPGRQPSPASDYSRAISNIPCRKEEALHDRFMGDPKFSVFVNELLTKPPVSYPVTPAAQFFLDQIERQREFVVFGNTTPEEAARRIEADVNAEIFRIRNLLERLEP